MNAIFHTKQWLTQSVINHQFCPYAKQPFEQDIIGYHIYSGNHIIGLLESLAQCCIALDEKDSNTLETSLLIVANIDSGYLADFYDYLDALAVINDFLDNTKPFLPHFSDQFSPKYLGKIPHSWSEDYQIASFHPNYQFDGTTAEDLENFTNRSPYPIFHLIRNNSIEAVRMNDARATQIVEQNIQTIESLSAEALQILHQLAKPTT